MLVDGLRDLQGLVGQGPSPATNSPRCHGRRAGRSFCYRPPLVNPTLFTLHNWPDYLSQAIDAPGKIPI